MTTSSNEQDRPSTEPDLERVVEAQTENKGVPEDDVPDGELEVAKDHGEDPFRSRGATTSS